MQSSLRKIGTMKKTEYKVPADNRAPDPGKRRGLGAPSEGGGGFPGNCEALWPGRDRGSAQKAKCPFCHLAFSGRERTDCLISGGESGRLLFPAPTSFR